MAFRFLPSSSSFLLFFFIFFLGAVCDAFIPPDNYLIICGSSTNATVGGRIFLPDSSLPKSMLSAPSSVSLINSGADINGTAALYQSARVFTAPSFYTFPVNSPGRHFIRLYFLPFLHTTYNLTAAEFTVTAQGFVLLAGFRPPPANSTAAFKEFSMNLTSSTFVLGFTPSSSSHLAFVNAIELVSVPDDLVGDTAQTVSPAGKLSGLSEMTMETVYRVNMGGPEVLPESDTLWRFWVRDAEFLLNANAAKFVSFSGAVNYQNGGGGATEEDAPAIVYSTATELAPSPNTTGAVFNVTWVFDIDDDDPSSTFLIRMHFCDFVSEALNNLYFNVFINQWSALGNLDLSTATGGVLASPYYADFAVVPGGSGKLNISIGPSTLANVLPDGILNGLEISKLMVDSSGGELGSPSQRRSSMIRGVWFVVTLVVAAAAALAAGFLMVAKKKKLLKKYNSRTWVPLPFYSGGSSSQSSGKSSGGVGFKQSSYVGLQFSFSMLKEATRSFDENSVIGVGGFGKVYKGKLKDGTVVAVKRGNPKSQQGLKEFQTEIELLSRLRHRHLVSLIGYCHEGEEMLLVYEYMEQGTLKSHLYAGSGAATLPCLSWKQRLEICIGSAKGLHYLHTGQSTAVIHRDVKTANILLDGNLQAKVADFGLSKTGPEVDKTHVSTAVKGSFGYLDPEYFRRQQLSEKSDVYSFGVVMLEVLCARPVIDPSLPRDMVSLAEWAMGWQRKGEVGKVVDARLEGTVRPESLRKFAETAEKCLEEYGVDRPAMGDVLWNLEYALQLQEAPPSELEMSSIEKLSELVALHAGAAVAPAPASEVVVAGADAEYADRVEDVSMSKVFSQLIKAEGR